MKHFLVFGIQPKLSLAEAHAVIDGPAPLLCGPMAVFSSGFWDGTLFQDRLAGTVKLGDIQATVPVQDLSPALLADLIESRPREERILYGLTIYGADGKTARMLKHLPINLKKELKRRGKSARWVTGEHGTLSPAAVSKLKLTSEGYDIVIGVSGNEAHVGLTTHVQNADAWSKRDFGRPFRDAKTGMLPPKLARMMVNLAVGLEPAPDSILLDPFCGGGTVVMEAALMFEALRLIGSDIDAKQIAGSQENIRWLIREGVLAETDTERMSWRVHPAKDLEAHLESGPVRYIVTEGFLGRPLQGNESQKELDRRMGEVEDAWKESLPALARLQPPGGRIVCAWPNYKTQDARISFDPSEWLHESGYRMFSPLADWSAENEPLLYTRPDQHVARQIVVLERL